MSQKQLPSASNLEQLSNTPLNKLIIKFTIPLALGMMLNGLYNVVDAFFVSRFIGTEALSSVSLAFPVQMFLIATAAAISNGTSVIFSRSLGADRLAEALKIERVGLLLAIAVSLIITLLSISFINQITSALNVPTNLINSTWEYLLPIICCCLFTFLLSFYSDLLRAEGAMGQLFIVILWGALLNIVLDVIFIVIFDGGLKGAAAATLLSQFSAIIIAIKLRKQSKVKSKLNLSLNDLFFMTAKIISTGTPIFFQFFGSVMVIGFINSILGLCGDPPLLAAYGIVNRINIFLIFPLIALAHATQTIVSFNYGAGSAQRVKSAFLWASKASFVYLLLLQVILIGFTRNVVEIFTNHEAVILHAISIIEVMYITLPLAGVTVITVAYLQGVGRPLKALILSLSKVYLLLMPLLMLTWWLLDFKFIWYSFPIAEMMSLLLCITLFFKTNKSLRRYDEQSAVRA
ncbi:MATE family efflux transporter [Thalassotalea ponticola]|uniref:MATE family efflux transporter n=1 Tax=Thalassotalea ponticola TaxID=1523392 RepID=UPI0025B35829|nr:MATE family efflux transporter [Thalassotalea ponticola]MDN3651672.1 MATE family efflux transporter [Thalassotalea ponticola]